VATTLKRGQGVTAVHQHIARIQAGLSYRAVENLQKALHIPLETMASVLGMSRATLHRRKNQGKIDQHESERLVRYQRLLGTPNRRVPFQKMLATIGFARLNLWFLRFRV